MRIGLFGGSFNPIHNAHIALASTIRKEARLDEVWFMVSPQNPLKQAQDLLGENERYEMVKLALDSRPSKYPLKGDLLPQTGSLPTGEGGGRGLKASNYEFHLERPSFTWKTLEALKKDFPQHEFSLIIGGDNWVAFPRWAHNEEILANHHIYIYPREDSEIDEATLPENVHLIHTPKINITSTMLREMVRNGKDISAFVPNAVAKAITDKRYYAPQPPKGESFR
jgi:nicotinate-nucleotide adenylyltransferase